MKTQQAVYLQKLIKSFHGFRPAERKVSISLTNIFEYSPIQCFIEILGQTDTVLFYIGTNIL
mgnify:CR=1 FL=1